MQYYSHSNYPIQIAHFPGQSRITSKEVLDEGKQTRFYKPYNVDIVSVITPSYLNDDNTALDYQLRLNEISYINPAKKHIGKWTNSKKVAYIIKGLKQCKQEYVLVLDGADVCVMSDLTDIVERFKTYKKDIIFNATVWHYPKVEIDNVEDRKQYGKYCYLNAGCCIGKKEALIKFYEECYRLIRQERRKNPSEQFYVRQVFDKHKDKVFFDYECKIFQIWHKPEYEYVCYVN